MVDNTKRPYRSTIFLRAWKLKTGEKIPARSIATFDRVAHSHHGIPFATADRSITLVNNRRLVHVVLSDLKADQPLRFDPSTLIPVVPNKKTATLKHPVIGGEPPYTYSLLSEADGLSLDEKTGELRMDVATVRAQLAAGLEKEYRTKYFRSERLSHRQSALAQIDNEIQRRVEADRRQGLTVHPEATGEPPVDLVVRLW